MYSQKRLKRLTLCAMLIAISVVIGFICKLYFTFGPGLRFTLENFGVLFIGYLFGPVYGLVAGLLTDIITSYLTAQAFNPIVCLGAGAVGLFCGLFARICARMPSSLPLYLSVAAGHIVGSMLIKSIGLVLFIPCPPETFLYRVPLYIAIGACEITLIGLCLKNNAIKKYLEDLK